MVGSYDKAKEANCYHCSHHSHIPERFFLTCVVGDDVRDYTKARKDKNVYFRVAEESE